VRLFAVLALSAASFVCFCFASSTPKPGIPLTHLPPAGYNSQGERLVAGIVPLSADRNHVILIQSTRRKGWVLPKGGWESDESCQESAVREAWEEAGITVNIDYDLGNFEEKRPPKTSKDRSRYYFYQGTVLDQLDEWPEKDKREREWFTYTKAIEVLVNRPELQEALNRSSMNRT
jgi:diphosphoinositol-polyphosphate diphosphatase